MNRTWMLPALAGMWVLLMMQAFGNLTLPSVIGSHMVLQRETEAAIWGWEKDPDTQVTVQFREKTLTTVSDAEGKWLVRVPTGLAGGPFTMTITGQNEVKLTDILVGEVWVAGGQSNMWWSVNNSLNSAAEIAKAKDGNLRIWDATRRSPNSGGWEATTPQKTVKDTEWLLDTPTNAGGFPATPYYFAREMREKLGVPVGIVHVGVPGQPIEYFISPGFFERHFAETVKFAQYRKAMYPLEKKQYDDLVKAWETARADAEALGKPAPKKPEEPKDPSKERTPSCLYNGMVAPVAPFTARGFLWWQGESNSNKPLQYSLLFPGMIQDWREQWGNDNMPFLYVELANFGTYPDATQMQDAPWPAVRGAQLAALSLPGVAMASTIDILDKDEWQIHPPNKQLAGHRLALAARAIAYGEKTLVWSGPTFKAMAINGKTITLTFNHVGSGLQVKGEGAIRGFAVAGADRNFLAAEAKIVGETIVLTAPEAITAPVAVRYAWANNPNVNLFNKEGLPMNPFRTDQWLLRPH